MNTKVILILVLLTVLAINVCLSAPTDQQNIDHFMDGLNESICFPSDHKLTQNDNYYGHCVRVCYQGKNGQICYQKCG